MKGMRDRVVVLDESVPAGELRVGKDTVRVNPDSGLRDIVRRYPGVRFSVVPQGSGSKEEDR